MKVRAGCRSWRHERYRTLNFVGHVVHVAEVAQWMYRYVMGGKVGGKAGPGPGVTVRLSSAAEGAFEAADDGQPKDTQLLHAYIDNRPVPPWAVLLDGQTVVFRRAPYELAPLPPFEPQPGVDDLLNIRAFTKRQEMEAVWEARHMRTVVRRAMQPAPGVKRRVQARGIPQIHLRAPANEEEAEHALVNPIGGALVVLKSEAEKAEDVRLGRHMRYVPVK
ncbi:hypothetical protein WJX74_001527 [Apatococcus lobatus]|uniref:Uncharacterized protein n=1 Tax=Apatococcus lobatus TaxID=904363 RepID=A0AAW1SER4_9CHLO